MDHPDQPQHQQPAQEAPAEPGSLLLLLGGTLGRPLGPGLPGLRDGMLSRRLRRRRHRPLGTPELHRKPPAKQQRKQGEELGLGQCDHRRAGQLVEQVPLGAEQGKTPRSLEPHDVHEQDPAHREPAQDIDNLDPVPGPNRTRGCS